MPETASSGIDQQLPLTPSGPVKASPSTQWSSRLVAMLLAWLLCVSWTLAAGKDLNWDALAYHLYAGFSAINDRFELDFFAGGIPSYLNPFASVPFYLMVKADWPSPVIGIVLASWQALNLWLIWELALASCRKPLTTRSRTVAFVAMILAFANPVFLQQLGSSFTDATTAPFVIAGYLFVMRAASDGDRRLLIVGGLLLGAAAGLKLTNALYAVAALPIVWAVCGRWFGRLDRLMTFSSAVTIGLIIVHGPWAIRLIENFGNPFFPFMNGLFHSADFAAVSIDHIRFVPQSWSEALARPFEMASPYSMVHTEPSSPDLRYAVLVVVVLLAILRTGIGSLTGARQDIEQSAAASRALWLLSLGFLLAWALWLMNSGNSRYFMPMGLLAGLLVAMMLDWAVRSKRLRAISLVGVIGTQALQIGFGADTRWNESSWDRHWFQVAIAEELTRAPSQYLSVDIKSSSFYLPFLAPGSGLVNLNGGMAIGPDGPGGVRVRSLIDRHQNSLRSLFEFEQKLGTDGPEAADFDRIDGRLKRFGLINDRTDCAFLDLAGQTGDFVDFIGPDNQTAIGRRLRHISCRLERKPGLAIEHARETAPIDRVFDRIEARCPSLFRPRHVVTESDSTIWRRMYVSTDTMLWTSGEQIYYQNVTPGGGDLVAIGSIEQWTRDDYPSPSCHTRPWPRFAAR